MTLEIPVIDKKETYCIIKKNIFERVIKFQ